MSKSEAEYEAQIADLSRRLEAEKGKALAAARAQAQAEREAVKAKEHADTYRAETDVMIMQAADHLRQGYSIGVGIFALSCWAGEVVRRKDQARRMLHRQTSMVKILADFVSFAKTKNQSLFDAAVKDAETAVSVFKTNTDRLKEEGWQALMVLSKNESDETLKKIREILEA